MQKTTIAISGMSCGGCVSAVRKALEAVPGTKIDAVTVGSATLHYDASRTSPETIAQAIRDAGYEPVGAGAPVAAGVASKAGSCCG
ncbi:MAG: heavy-metal-associated domain-containing protein [Acidobacteriota bacterium]